MVSYRKRGKSWQFEISYKDAEGNYKKYRKSGYRLKSEAEEAAVQFKASHGTPETTLISAMPFAQYFEYWVNTYKKPIVRNISMVKYRTSINHAVKLFVNTPLNEITRAMYQQKINHFAKTHSIRTVQTLHKQFRAALLDALDEHYIHTDPTRKISISGLSKKIEPKSLNYEEWVRLLNSLNLVDGTDLIIRLAAVTGMRYGEIVGLTKSSIDFTTGLIRIDKTWDYKYRTGFQPTKNSASNRIIPVDIITLKALKRFVEPIVDQEVPIFTSNGRIMVSSEINVALTNRLKDLYLPRITFHGLRHTHASILLYKGVSILSVSRRLGHSSSNTTQATYLHIVRELEEMDTEKILNIISPD